MNDPAFDEDRNAMILGLKDKGVEFVMNVGCCLESSGDCIKLAEEYPFVYASVGSHPDSADEVNEKVLEQYRQMAKFYPYRSSLIGINFTVNVFFFFISIFLFRSFSSSYNARNNNTYVIRRPDHRDYKTIKGIERLLIG